MNDNKVDENNTYNVEFSGGEVPKNLNAILEDFIHITTDYADDTEQIHIYGDKILLDTLKYILIGYFHEVDAGETLHKIIKMFENNPAWYS